MRRRLRGAVAAIALLAPLALFAEAWDSAEVAEAQKLQAAEAARAAEYRARVARGEVRSARAPMPREAPGRPDGSAGDSLREAADVVDFIERLFGRRERGADERARERERELEGRASERARCEQLRRRARDRRSDPADDWWREEEERLRAGE